MTPSDGGLPWPHAREAQGRTTGSARGLEATVKTFPLSPSSSSSQNASLKRSNRLAAFARSARPIVSAEHSVNLGHPEPSVADVALKLAERLGSLRQRPVRIDHGVAGR